ncbi:TPA: type I toxin-antitoxin system Ibs family toxin [Escherichia coli]
MKLVIILIVLLLVSFQAY